MSMSAATITTVQRQSLRFLATCGQEFAQIKVRTARPLIAKGLVVSRPDSDPDADAAAGGWTFVGLTERGRGVIA